MLYIETPEAFVPWTGQPVNGVRHPTNIEDVWTDEEIAAAGLFKPADADPVPEGKVVVSAEVQRVNGVVKYVNTLADVPAPQPEDFSLSDGQLRTGLIKAGISLSTITDAIDKIADPVQRSITQIWWDRSILIEWANPMMQTIITLSKLDEAQFRSIWLSAKDLPA